VYERVQPFELARRLGELEGKPIEIVDVLSSPWSSGYAPPEMAGGVDLIDVNGELRRSGKSLDLQRLRGVVRIRREYRSTQREIEVHAVDPAPDVKTYEVVDRTRLERDGKALDRRRIEYVGRYEKGFEQSTLDDVIWIDFASREAAARADEARKAKRVEPGSGPKVRARGRLATGGSYGHLGRRRFQLNVEELEYL
jgi:hypothetical protein